jgi:hypothetical protein
MELDHTMVSIRFIGKDLDPERQGELLGFTETERTRSTIKRRKGGVVVWSIAYEDNEAASLEKEIAALLALFTKDKKAWAQATENVKADIFCGLFLDEWNQGFGLPARLLKELADRNLEIGFDVYSPSDESDKLNERFVS